MIHLNYPCLNLSKSINQDARNILKIASWFKGSKAADITLSQSFELVSKMCGFKSYAALKSSGGVYGVDIAAVKAIEDAKHISPIDLNFYRAIFSYLITPASDYSSKQPVYAIPSSLLIHCIQNYHEKSDHYFANLVAVNAIGHKVLYSQLLQSTQERDLIENAVKGELLANFIKCTPLHHKGVFYGYDWFFKRCGEWVLMTLENINCPIELDELKIPIDKLLVVLGAKSIESVKVSSSVIDNSHLLTTWNSSYVEMKLGYTTTVDEEAVYTEGSVRNWKFDHDGVVVHDWLTVKIKYTNQIGKPCSIKIDNFVSEYGIALKKGEVFAFAVTDNEYESKAEFIERLLESVSRKGANPLLRKNTLGDTVYDLLGCISSSILTVLNKNPVAMMNAYSFGSGIFPVDGYSKDELIELTSHTSVFPGYLLSNFSRKEIHQVTYSSDVDYWRMPGMEVFKILLNLVCSERIVEIVKERTPEDEMGWVERMLPFQWGVDLTERQWRNSINAPHTFYEAIYLDLEIQRRKIIEERNL